VEIDWVTVAAQVVNFLVLVWLLRRFLYGPITRAMARREQRIEGRLSEAREQREAAAEEKAALEAERAELEESREAELEEARAEARETRERLERELREEIAQERRRRREALDAERDAFLDALRRRASAHLFEMLRAALSDFADAELSEQVVARFVETLEGLDDDTRARLAEAAQEEDGAARVESALPLTSALRARLTRALHETVSPDLAPDYHQDEEVALGIRLTVGGRVLEWSASAHLDRLQAKVAEELEALRAAPAGAGAGAAANTA
jgi:F-type H+-transporting ATPase subunit b